jgi:hypothetical protein
MCLTVITANNAMGMVDNSPYSSGSSLMTYIVKMLPANIHDVINSVLNRLLCQFLVRLLNKIFCILLSFLPEAGYGVLIQSGMDNLMDNGMDN